MKPHPKILITGILLIMAGMLAWRGFGGEWLRYATWIGAAMIGLGSIRSLGAREIYLIVLSVTASVCAYFWLPDPFTSYANGLDQAAFLMAFLLLLTILFETAVTSSSVQECGRHVASQPTGRRHAALFGTSNVLSVLFNLSIASLLSPLIERGLPNGINAAQRIALLKPQLNAVLRGFSWSVVWSPTALAPIALMELIDGVDRFRWSILGIGLAVGAFLISSIEQRHSTESVNVDSVITTGPTPWMAYGKFGLTISAFIAIALAVVAMTGDTIVFGLMVGCVIMMVVWLYAQTGTALDSSERMQSILFDRLPNTANAAITLGCSGYLGRVTASLIPVEQVEHMLAALSLPDWLLLSALPVVITALSYLAISPIMFAVFFGALFGGFSVLPVDPTLLALSISCGWALTMTASPFATIAIMLGRQNSVPPLSLTLRWNGVYSLATVLLISISFFILTGGS